MTNSPWAELAFLITAYIFFYFIAINLFYFFFLLLSLVGIYRHNAKATYAGYRTLNQSAASFPVSILVPCHNEEPTIIDAIHALLKLDYPEYEVIVINDGSTDNTLQVLVEEFQLEPMDWVIRQEIDRRTGEVRISTKPIRRVYVSPSRSSTKELIVLDKDKGGKADALNAGLLASRYPLFCSVDADSILDTGSLLKLVKPFLEDPEHMVANGGIVRIANGCVIERATIKEARLPHQPLLMLQVVEYLRAFLGARLGKSQLKSLLIISGVFSLFRKDVVIKVAGYSTKSLVEDMDLVVRMHRYLREQKKKYHIAFIPEPIAWTQAPFTLRDLYRQRLRWQRGLLETLWANKVMLFNPAYGVIGMFAMPFYVIFEALGPVVEILGYLAVILFYVLGILNWQVFLLFLALAFIMGTLISLLSLFILEFSQKRYPRPRDTIKLVIYGILDNFGYRQLTMLWRARAIFRMPLRKKEWGHIARTGFQEELPAKEEREVSAPSGAGPAAG